MSLEQSTQELIGLQQPSSPKDVLPPSTITKVAKKKNNYENNNSNNDTSSSPIDSDCPLWASEPVISRNDHLKFFKGGERVSTFIIPLDELKYVILGRSTTLCDFALSHPTISRKHALLAHDSVGRLNIVDLNSSHGTFVDQVRIESQIPVLLKHGQKIYFGGDQSYMVVSNNNMNRYMAETLLLKKMDLSRKRSESPSPPDDKTFEAEEESLKDEITKFYSHLNKTQALDDVFEIESIKETIKKLTPTNSPSKKYSGSKRKNCIDIYDKNVRFSSLVSRFVYSEEDQVSDKYPTVQSVDTLNDAHHQQPTEQQPQKPKLPTKPLLFPDFNNSNNISFNHCNIRNTNNTNNTTELSTPTTTTTTTNNLNNSIFSSTMSDNFLISFNQILQQPTTSTTSTTTFEINQTENTTNICT